MSAVALASYFQLISAFFSGLVAIKLYTTGLYHRYKIFFVYIIFRIPCQVTSWFRYRQDPNSRAYLDLFLYTEPIVLLFYILVVMELYSLVLEHYKGLYTLGRWAMYVALTISVTISVLTLLPKIAPSTPEPSKYLFKEVAVERGVDLSLVLFILLIVLFLSRYRITLSRNVLIHTGIYALFFLSETLVLLLRTLWGIHTNDLINVGLTVLSCTCAFLWWSLLSAKGEEIKVNAPEFRPDSEERILHQLDALNQTLLKVSRK